MIATILKAIAPVLPWLAVLLVLFVLFVLVYLFIAFKNNPEKTAKALLLELTVLRKAGNLFTRKSDTVVTADGIVKPPRLSDTAILEQASLPQPPEKKP